MRAFIFIETFLCLVSCSTETKNLDGTLKNYTPFSRDKNCINPWNQAFFEFKSLNIDSVTALINAKITAVLGSKVYDENNHMILKDSVRKAMFTYDSAFIRGDIQIDTVNLLQLKDYLSYYSGSQLTPGIFDGKYILTQKNLSTFYDNPKFNIEIELHPCIKKIIGLNGKFKRLRQNQEQPEHARGSAGYVDQVNEYTCLTNLSIYIQIDDKSKMINPDRQFYEIKLTDSCNVFTSVDL